jgi:nucleotidyltransferase/DNA polymerase involved in DNA repair
MTAVVKDEHVIDLNQAAIDRGLALGMPISEVKSILAGDGQVYRWDEEVFRDAQRAWLDICADHTDVIEPIDQHSALLDLSGHPQPEQISQRIATVIQEKLGLSTSCGLGGSRWVAQAALRQPGMVAVLTPKRFVSPLSVSQLPIPEAEQTRLCQLGCRTIGQVARLELDTLRAQFGNSAFTIKLAAMGSGERHVNAVYPPDTVASRFAFESAPDAMEPYHNGLLNLCKDLGAKLIEQDSYGEAVDVWLEHESGEATKLSRTFTKPLSSPGSCWASLRLLLSEPPEKPVTALRVRMLGVRKVRRVQLSLQGTLSRSQRSESSAAAIEHLRASLGDGVLKLGSEIIEPRYKQVRKAWRLANGWTWT